MYHVTLGLDYASADFLHSTIRVEIPNVARELNDLRFKRDVYRTHRYDEDIEIFEKHLSLLYRLIDSFTGFLEKECDDPPDPAESSEDALFHDFILELCEQGSAEDPVTPVFKDDEKNGCVYG